MAPDAVAQSEPVVSDAERRKSILLIEDDESQVLALTRRLENQGYRVLSAGEGQRGLTMARRGRPDLVILDLRLPDMDGLEVCEQLADSPHTCGIPVIVLSGADRPDIVRRSRAAGCRYFLHKPYDPNALLTLLQHALESAGRGEW